MSSGYGSVGKEVTIKATIWVWETANLSGTSSLSAGVRVGVVWNMRGRPVITCFLVISMALVSITEISLYLL